MNRRTFATLGSLLFVFAGTRASRAWAAQSPDYLICMECDTPCYVFEWENGKVTEALCQACGNDDVDQFALPEELEEEAEAASGDEGASTDDESGAP